MSDLGLGLPLIFRQGDGHETTLNRGQMRQCPISDLGNMLETAQPPNYNLLLPIETTHLSAIQNPSILSYRECKDLGGRERES
jgi:hypothetical protein